MRFVHCFEKAAGLLAENMSKPKSEWRQFSNSLTRLDPIAGEPPNNKP